MKPETIIQREVNQKEKHQYSILMHILEFRKMVMTTRYVRQQKRHRCIEQSVGLRGRRQGWDDLRETCILPYVKQMTSPSSMHETSLKLKASALREWDGEGGGGQFRDRGDTCTSMADSYHCMAKATTIL